MDAVTRLELQRHLETIKLSQTGFSSSPVRYFAAWAALIAAIVVLGLWFAFQPESSRVVIPFLAVAIAIRSLYTIMHQENMKRFRPILEALLAVPEDLPKQEVSQTPGAKKRRSALPKKR
jgi:hypothetical protein